MHVSLNHQNLNIFNHFGDSAQNENNTTRAFLIAATRSPWSPMLLRGFFDLVAARIRERLPDQAAVLGSFSQSWPDQVEISMERDIKAESFPGVGVERAIIVELTPLGAALDPPQQMTEVGDSGRIDATIVIRQSLIDADFADGLLGGQASAGEAIDKDLSLRRQIAPPASDIW